MDKNIMIKRLRAVPLLVSDMIKELGEMGTSKESAANKESAKVQIVWRNVLLLGNLHIAALYGAYLMVTVAKWETVVAWYFLCVLSGMGITAGAHRLWAHRSYKAKWPLRVILCALNTMALQNDLYEWCRDHRVHHKFSETDADPHNANRGFFFAHMGWLLCKKHPDVLEKGKTVDLSDIWSDPIVRFQRRYYFPLVLLLTFIVPTLIPQFGWGETAWNSFFICSLFRYCYVLHTTWLVNSAAHMWGNRPYDTGINPRENNLVTYGSYGEGYHNYHHTFPWDYAASELAWMHTFNFTTMFIDFFSALGWAYDRKRVSRETLQQRQERTGVTDDDDHHHHLTTMMDGENSGQHDRLLWRRWFIIWSLALSHLWIPFLLRFFLLIS